MRENKGKRRNNNTDVQQEGSTQTLLDQFEGFYYVCCNSFIKNKIAVNSNCFEFW